MTEDINEAINSDFEKFKTHKLESLKYHRAICLLICGATADEVAKELGTTKRSVQRWFQSPEFNENLQRAISITFRHSLAKAALFADKAIQILIDIAEDATQPTKYRLQAIQTLFDISFKAGLNATPQLTPIQEEIEQQKSLLSSLNQLRVVSSQVEAFPTSQLQLASKAAIWNELYPDEPYPDEDGLRSGYYGT